MKKNKWLNIIVVILAVIMLLSFILSFEPVAKVAADMVGKPVEAVKSFARTVLLIAIGAFLVTTGVTALTVPLLGAALIIVGLGLIYWGAAPLFRSSSQPSNVIPNQ